MALRRFSAVSLLLVLSLLSWHGCVEAGPTNGRRSGAADEDTRSQKIFSGRCSFSLTILSGQLPVMQINLIPASLVASCMLLVYDWACTLDREVDFVWSHPLSFSAMLFFINRYLPFVDTFTSMSLSFTQNSPEKCIRHFKVVTWFTVVGILLCEVILMLRTYAIWERKRSVMIGFIILILVVAVPSFVFTGLELNSLVYRKVSIGCHLVHASPIIMGAYLLLLFCETVIAVLMLIKAIRHLRPPYSPWVAKLYRDGLLFYLYLLALSLANVVIPICIPSLSNWLATPQRVFHSIFCTRILLLIMKQRSPPRSPILDSTDLTIFMADFPSGSGVTDSSALASSSSMPA